MTSPPTTEAIRPTSDPLPPETGADGDLVKAVADAPTEKGASQTPTTATPTSQPSMATRLVALVRESDAELWHDLISEQPYVTVSVGDHREHYQIDTRPARGYLARLAHRHFGRVPGRAALQDAMTVLGGIGRYDGAAYPVAVRIASHGATLVLDLGDATWRAVVIRGGAWTLVDEAPVRFRRPRGMLALPVPTRGSSLDDLQDLIGIEDDRTWTQAVGWLIGTLAPRGPYPVLAILGEQGATKTFTARLLRGLVDPNRTPLRGPVRDERDLMIAASHSHVIGFDNISKLPDWLSDGLCRVATGGGFATRALFTDDDEHVIDVMRPIILTAISTVIRRGDLLDRTSLITLPALAESRRRPEADLVNEYEALRPGLLGALLDVASAALRQSAAGASAAVLPRMADHAIWVSAAEEALGWHAGTYVEAYTGQQQDAVEIQLDGDALVQALRKLMADRDEWVGTSTELLETLARHAPDTSREAGWPRAPRGLTARLDRLAPDLRRTGLDLRRHHDGKQRLITLRSVSCVSSVTAAARTNLSVNATTPAEAPLSSPQGDLFGSANAPNAPNAPDGQLTGPVGELDHDDDLDRF